MHLLPQSFEPPRQSTPHMPWEQTWPWAQATAQSPQFPGSFVVSTHASPQTFAEAPTQPAPIETDDDVVDAPPPVPVVPVPPFEEQPPITSAAPSTAP
jgi:hypothetical protein